MNHPHKVKAPVSVIIRCEVLLNVNKNFIYRNTFYTTYLETYNHIINSVTKQKMIKTNQLLIKICVVLLKHKALVVIKK